ncbi:helix-turn-helix domain-containing protein [Streptomyces ziwulingensis]|uniref:Helix-turn-helix domain-containing protein n=1 Tax=Streptomyces ziwulingensis TaxID=1045501 RepID=A0ABP9CMB8_9ACTN
MSPVLMTSLAPAEQALAYWRDAVDRTLLPMTVVPRWEGPFTGRLVTGRVGALRVASVEADAQRVRRRAAHIAASPEPFVAVGVQLTGRTVLVQNDREATAQEGGLFVYDTARPYFLDHPERFSLRVVRIPRRLLALSDEDVEGVAGSVFDTDRGCAAVLRPFITTMVAAAHRYSPSAAEGLADGLINLFATLVAERNEETAAGTGPARNQLVQRVREHIDRNLGDPALSPETVARAHHISVRYLHRLFEDEGVTVGRLIQRRRLEECAHELARRGRTTPTVSAVAQRWGFVNPTHFSRVFRSTYGLSPREWRTARLDAGRAEAGERPGAQAWW